MGQQCPSGYNGGRTGTVVQSQLNGQAVAQLNGQAVASPQTSHHEHAVTSTFSRRIDLLSIVLGFRSLSFSKTFYRSAEWIASHIDLEGGSLPLLRRSGLNALAMILVVCMATAGLSLQAIGQDTFNQGIVDRGIVDRGIVDQGTLVEGTFAPTQPYASNPLESTDDLGAANDSAASPKTPSRIPKGNTWVETPTALQELLTRGGVPDSLDTLRLLQRQQQIIAARAADCTVSIQIGPAQGCGVIITDSGYVLTAAHVAMRPNKAAVLTLADGRTVTAMTRGMNRHVDAGLMKIDPNQNSGRPWPHATLGSSDNLKTGMWCIATGHPGGYDRNRGMVTRVGRILDVREGSIVTDCALIGGDSGGPLFDLSGRLIAVHSRIGNDVADNLHVPVNHYDDSWSQMDAGESWGYLPGFKPALGVRGNSSDNQALVKEVNPGSPAKDAGIEPGDIVERFGEIQITGFESLKQAVSNTMPGERVKVWVRRNGNLVRVVVEIGRANDRY